MRKGFIFDMNKCVGCQACVIACQIENHSVLSEPWRQVSTSNDLRHPLLPLFHFTIACNHCEIPLCLEHCPSRAYSKDELLGTIDHNADRCIGCRYCTWACPYDAPKFIHARGVVEKCTMCKGRIMEGLKPNCAALCPTGALDFGEMSGKPVVRVSGFVDKGMRPGIEIIPLRKSRPRSPVVQAQAADESGLFKRLLSTGPTKTGLKQEWPLIIFTILASLLFGFFAASVFKPIGVDPVAFLATGIIGMGLSAIHLGKKFRAWRAIVNVKTSWLSREIGACFLFLILCGLSVSVVHAESMRVAAMIAGLVMLISIDMVYSVAEGKPMPGLHSASVLVTGILFFSAFSQMMSLFVLVSGWKFILYGFEFVQASERSLPRTVLSILRIVAGFIVPLLLFGGPSGRTAAGVLLIVAELANRAEFYADLKILTPLRQVEKDLVRELG